jgi:dUTP pyrophosphatase
MKVKIKKLDENAIIPSYSKKGDAGMDLVCVSKYYDEYGNIVYGTGIAMEIPENHVGLLFPRSSNAKKDLIQSNSVGVIDSGYRGEIILKFKPSGFFADDSVAKNGEIRQIRNVFDYIAFPDNDEKFGFHSYKLGDRIAQLIIIPYPQIEFEEVSELSDTERGTGNYGSTGN